MFDLIMLLVPLISSEAEVKHTAEGVGGSQPEKGQRKLHQLGTVLFLLPPGTEAGQEPSVILS